MLNLLIADDEELERRAVKNIIGKSFEGQFNIFEAKNGRQAIEVADKEKPEIIIMDIKMPGIDGIEAIKEISKFSGESYFIVLSAYDYFNYAKEAMKCGVKDYILKPLKKDELINKIKEAVYYIEENKNKRKEEIEIKERLKTIQPIVQNELCYAFINNMATADSCKGYLEFLNVSFNSGYCIIMSIKDKYKYAAINEIERVEMKNKIKDYVYDYINLTRKCISTCLYTNDIVFFIETPKEYDKYMVKVDSINMVRDIAARIKNKFDVSILAGIGRVYDNIKNLEKSYNEAIIALNYDNIDMRVRHYDDIFGNEEPGIYYSIELEKVLVNSIYKGEVEESCKIFNDIMIKACEGIEDMNKVKTIVLQMILTIVLSINKSGDSGIDIEAIQSFIRESPIENIEDSIVVGNKVIADIIKNVSNKYTDSQEKIIKRSIEYIKNNFKGDLTLEIVADYACVSPYYFSKIFKKFTGTNYIDYLTDIRIEKAKEMLRDGRVAVKDVCFNVGYNDPNYFSRVFKKIVGLSPKEFKEGMA